MFQWDPNQYAKFDRQRTRPVFDLLAQVSHPDPRMIVDLGCGTGNSTLPLRARWPQARILALDSSAEMLAEARRAADPSAGIEWVEGDQATWADETGDRFDLIFSNASLQWSGDHDRLFPALVNRLAPGGVLAVQMPRNFDAPAHRLMRDLAADGPWAPRLAAVRDLIPVDPPATYYNRLSGLVADLSIWETDYIQIMADVDAIIDWVRGTGLRPFLAPLTAAEQAQFLARYRTALMTHFPPQPDGRVLFPFRRLFLVARR